MKLIIGGATGFAGRHILRQALKCPEITSIITLGRRAIDIQDPKITDIVMEDQEHYSDAVLEQIGDADACIWTIAIPFTAAQTAPFPEVKKVTRDYTLAAITALSRSRSASKKEAGKPLRFIYFSGAVVTRDSSFDWEAMRGVVRPEYARLRCNLEIELINIASSSEGKVEVCCIRPGYIDGDHGVEGYVKPDLKGMVPEVKVEVLVAACLKMVVEGIEMDPVSNEELVRIGDGALWRFG